MKFIYPFNSCFWEEIIVGNPQLEASERHEKKLSHLKEKMVE